MRFKDFVVEDFASLTGKKNQWVDLTRIPDAKHDPELKQNLFDLVQTAYTKCAGEPNASIKSPEYVLGKYYNFWHAIDIDENPDAEACIFGRLHAGVKIAGIGHNGDKLSKTVLIRALAKLLHRHGYWIEACGTLGAVLEYKNVPIFNDRIGVSKLFPQSKITVWENGIYKRTLSGNKISAQERIFGRPLINLAAA